MNKNSSQSNKILVSAILLALPIIIYISKFGFYISGDHQRWAEMGSAMSGIYSPLIAFMALIILVRQANAQIGMNKHQIDHTFIDSSRKDIDFYLVQLDNHLKSPFDDKLTVRDYLEKHFQFLSESQLNSSKTKELAKNFNKQHYRVFDIWVAIYPLLIGLETPKEFPYEHNFQSSKLRVISILSLKTCISIDNLYICLLDDMFNGKSFFRPKG